REVLDVGYRWGSVVRRQSSELESTFCSSAGTGSGIHGRGAGTDNHDSITFAHEAAKEIEWAPSSVGTRIAHDRYRRLCRDGAGDDHGLYRSASRRITGSATISAYGPKTGYTETGAACPDHSASNRYFDSTSCCTSRATAGCCADDSSRFSTSIDPADTDGLISDTSPAATSTGTRCTHHRFTDSAIQRRTASQRTRRSNESRGKSAPGSGCRRGKTGAGHSTGDRSHDPRRRPAGWRMGLFRPQ